jgi:hypothetical protein
MCVIRQCGEYDLAHMAASFVVCIKRSIVMRAGRQADQCTRYMLVKLFKVIVHILIYRMHARAQTRTQTQAHTQSKTRTHALTN